MEDGKNFEINAKNNGPDNTYIQSAELNGATYNHTWLDHHTIQAGGTLNFKMGNAPEKTWGSDKGSVPFSLSIHR